MKIGILTFHRSINYGAFMQAYALSNEIKNRFPNTEVEVIDFDFLFKNQNYKRQANRFPWFVEANIKYYKFQQDLKKLPLSSISFITNNTNCVAEYINSHYDIVVVGSDAVWAFQKKMPIDNPYWLFGDKLKNVVKMSYAASAFTTLFDEINENDKSFIKSQLENFQYIGVRDTPTQHFINELLPDKHIHLNNDPTFFLPKSSDIKSANKILLKNFINPSNKFISFMTRDMPYLKELDQHLGHKYKFINFYSRNNPYDLFRYNRRLLSNLSPTEWYTIYSKVTMNFTYYFHGALLPIINNVPTILIDDSKVPYISKYQQVMTDLNLTDSFFLKDKLNKDLLFSRTDEILSNIDFEKERLNSAIQKELEKSNSFFDALKSYL